MGQRLNCLRKDQVTTPEKEPYKAFGRAVGMDVDRIERKAKAEQATSGVLRQKLEAQIPADVVSALETFGPERVLVPGIDLGR